MQAHERPEPYAVLEYQSSEPRVFGVEARPRFAAGLNTLLAGIRWVGKSEGFRKELTFVVMTMPLRATFDEIKQVAECARKEGMDDKLCLVIPSNAPRVRTIIASLKRFGIATLLGGVGKSSRLCELTDHEVNGIVIETGLVSQAAGDPQAAAILDAIVTLATSLGLKSFASECGPSEFNFARSTGINYVSRAESSVVPVGFSSRVHRTVVHQRTWLPSGTGSP